MCTVKLSHLGISVTASFSGQYQSCLHERSGFPLLGVIPGPKEPSLHMNTYLQPIVDELLDFDDGIQIRDFTRYGNIYRFRLLGFTCDLPACRKIGAMVSCSAKLGKHISQELSYTLHLIAMIECPFKQRKWSYCCS